MADKPQTPPINLEQASRALAAARNLPRLSEREIKALQESQRILSAVRNDVLASVMKSGEFLTPYLRQVAASYRIHIASSLPLLQENFLRQQWLEAARQTVASMEYSKKTIEEAGKALAELGWWIHPEWDLPALRDIIKAHGEGKHKEIEDAILGYFDGEKLDQMLSTWQANPNLKNRMHILKDAMWAHKQGKYTLSVPALLSQIEGIVIEDAGKTGKIRGKHVVKVLRQQLAQDLDPQRVISFWLSSPVLLFLEQLLKARFKWGQTKRARLGRDPILHGFFVDYATPALSLKLILLVDFLQEALRKP